MSRTAVIKKRPIERFPIGFRFIAPDLEEGESIVAATAEIMPQNAGGLDLVGSPTIDGNDTVSQSIDGGTDGHDYYVRFTVTTSSGNIYQDSIYVMVRESP
jgi:hypothetical protein